MTACGKQLSVWSNVLPSRKRCQYGTANLHYHPDRCYAGKNKKYSDSKAIVSHQGDKIRRILWDKLICRDEGVSKVNQICIQDDARLLERGKALLESVIGHGNKLGKLDFACGCADDLESNKFWQAMGWRLISKRHGRHYSNTWKDSSDRLVNIYHFQTDSLLFSKDESK